MDVMQTSNIPTLFWADTEADFAASCPAWVMTLVASFWCFVAINQDPWSRGDKSQGVNHQCWITYTLLWDRVAAFMPQVNSSVVIICWSTDISYLHLWFEETVQRNKYTYTSVRSWFKPARSRGLTAFLFRGRLRRCWTKQTVVKHVTYNITKRRVRGPGSCPIAAPSSILHRCVRNGQRVMGGGWRWWKMCHFWDGVMCLISEKRKKVVMGPFISAFTQQRAMQKCCSHSIVYSTAW